MTFTTAWRKARKASQTKGLPYGVFTDFTWMSLPRYKVVCLSGATDTAIENLSKAFGWDLAKRTFILR